MKTMDDETNRMLKFLRLPALLAHWDEYMALAQKQGFSHVRLLKYMLEQECLMKSENARTYRLNRANIPIRYVMETYPFDRQPKLDKKKILALYDAFDYVAKSQNIIFVGPAGCGKTGLATSFLIEAIHRGHTGRYVLFPDLVGELFKSVADHSEQRAIKRYLSYDCLLVDELDYVEVEPVQVGLFFTLMHKRHLKKPTLITSNLGFSEWRTFLKNDRLTAALVDRLTEKSYVINMKNCISLREKLSPDHDLPGDSK
jgi:DNA replication protein DnaC